MIIDKMIEVGFWLLDVVIALTELLPDVPSEFMNVVDMICSFLSDGITVINCFFDLNFLKICIPIWLTIAAADKLYHIIMWILRKIPLLGIQ